MFAILCTFRPNASAEAKAHRLEHYEFLIREKDNIVQGGPLLGPDGLPTAMLMVVERETIDEAQGFISQEPYNRSGLFESVAIRRWSHVIPQPTPDFIEKEHAKELAARRV